MSRSHVLSRAMSVATLGYAGYCLVKPDHLPRVLEAPADDQATWEQVARTYGVRDLAIGSLGLFGSAPKVRTSMALRVAMDLGDAGVLATRTSDPEIRRKVLAVTLGYAAANTLALVVDEARLRRAARSD